MSLRNKVGRSADDMPYTPSLCQTCPTGEAHVSVRGEAVCWSCYEQRRETQTIDTRRGEILHANPQWQRQHGESSRDYARRMSGECRRLLGQLETQMRAT